MSFDTVANLIWGQNCREVRRILQLIENSGVFSVSTPNYFTENSTLRIRKVAVSHIALSTHAAKPFWRGSGWKY
jgi:hypothetical protein